MSKRFAEQVCPSHVQCDDDLLTFEDVGELVKRFNNALVHCDFVAAACIIEALFAIDRHRDGEDFQAYEVQRTDLLCQCLDSFSKRMFCYHEQRRLAACRDTGATSPVMPYIDEQAVRHLGAVNNAIFDLARRYFRSFADGTLNLSENGDVPFTASAE